VGTSDDLARIRAYVTAPDAQPSAELVDTLYAAIEATSWILDALAGHPTPRLPPPSNADPDAARTLLAFLTAQHRGLTAMRDQMDDDQARLVARSIGTARNLVAQAARQTEGTPAWLVRSPTP
jgi:hypothetical protein